MLSLKYGLCVYMSRETFEIPFINGMVFPKYWINWCHCLFIYFVWKAVFFLSFWIL